MKKMFLLLSAGLLSASLAFAQDTSGAGQSTTPGTDTSNTAGSVQGCLSGSGGNYLLTQDGTGTTYKLMGNEDQLKKHVGHEVAVTGQMAGGAGSSASSSDQGQGQMSGADSMAIQVSDIKMVSRKCSSAANAPQTH